MENKNERKKLDDNSFLLIVAIILFSVMYTVGITMFGGGGFAKIQNFLNLFISNTGLTVVATGMMIIIVTGGIDISVGSVVAVVCMMLAWTMKRGNIGASPAILIVLVMGCIFDLMQDFLVAYLRIQPFIVALTSISFVRGMTSIISQEMINITSKMFTSVVTSEMYLPFGDYLNKKGVMIYPYVYLSAITALVAPVIVFVIPKYTKFGRSTYAIGGNEQSALLLGLNVRRIRLRAYALGGSLTGLGGLLLCTNTCSGSMEQAKGFEMDAIASSVISGTLLAGGVGSVIGGLLGVLIKGTIESFITFQGILSSWWVGITITVLLRFLIVLQSLITSLKRKNKQQETAVSCRQAKVNKKRLKI